MRSLHGGVAASACMMDGHDERLMHGLLFVLMHSPSLSCCSRYLVEGEKEMWRPLAAWERNMDYFLQGVSPSLGCCLVELGASWVIL